MTENYTMRYENNSEELVKPFYRKYISNKMIADVVEVKF